MTTALEGGEWSTASPGHTLPPGKTQYPFYRRLGGHQCWSGRAENLVPTGIQSQTVQPVISRYTNYATRPTCHHVYLLNKCMGFTKCQECSEQLNDEWMLKGSLKGANPCPSKYHFVHVIAEKYFKQI